MQGNWDFSTSCLGLFRRKAEQPLSPLWLRDWGRCFCHVPPVDADRTIYRYIILRTFAPDHGWITKSLEDLAEYAFRQEDEPMIAAVQTRMAGRGCWDMKPLILKTDPGSDTGAPYLGRVETRVRH